MVKNKNNLIIVAYLTLYYKLMAVIPASIGRELKARKSKNKKKKLIEMEQESLKKEDPDGFLNTALKGLAP